MPEKRFFWMKQRTDYYAQPEIDYLLTLKNGSAYVVIFQILCLLTANTEGIMAEEMGHVTNHFSSERIAREAKHFNKKTIDSALAEFLKIGLVIRQDDGIMLIPWVSTMVGSETKSAKKKRRQRANHDNEAVTQEPSFQSDEEDDIDDNFENIWAEYPRKSGKALAHRYYLQAREEGITDEVILYGLRAYTEKVYYRDVEFIRKGGNWFRDRGWEDT